MNSTTPVRTASQLGGEPRSAPLETAKDPAFPSLHARPAKGWINDPNGICRWNDRYHVFFQFNPESARHSAITWGHISSPDLLRWEEEPVALRPQPGGPDAFGCWSGVMADDDGVPTAVYSGVTDDSGQSQVTLARGSANLRTWNQAGETAAGMPEDESITAVRDPFIFRYQGRRYALQGAGLDDGRGALLLYDAENLGNWDYLGIWLTTSHPVAGKFAEAHIWECPQIIELDGQWLVIVSLWKRQDEQHHLSGVAHMIGRMDDDGGTPVFVPETGAKTDAGPDFYAPQLLALEDRALLWGWSWETRSEEDSDAAGWAGVLTFPRELAIEDDRLAVSPARELLAYRRDELPAGRLTRLPSTSEALVTPHGEVTIELALVSPSGTRVIHSASSDSTMRLFIDASIIEIFQAHSTAITLRAYPADDEHWALAVSGEASVTAWELGL